MNIYELASPLQIYVSKDFTEQWLKYSEKKYLRPPNSIDIERLFKKGKERGFPGMLWSLDCMHWGWKTCPTAWAGQYMGNLVGGHGFSKREIWLSKMEIWR